MQRRNLLASPLLMLAPTVALAASRRVHVVPSTGPLDTVEIRPSDDSPRIEWHDKNESSAAVSRMILHTIKNPGDLMVTSVLVVCHHEPLKDRIISMPGATEAELESARQQLERGETVSWPQRDCEECGGQHPIRKERVLVLYGDRRWAAVGLSLAERRLVTGQIHQLRDDPDYRMLVPYRVINHEERFRGRIIQMLGATDEELRAARDTLDRGGSIVWTREISWV